MISILQAVLKLVSDMANGTDFIGEISALVPLPESAQGIDQVGQLLAMLLVADSILGTDIEIVIKPISGGQVFEISFIIKRNSISFEIDGTSINFGNLIPGG